MFGLRYAKVSPSTYLIQYRNGQIVREGAGLAFFYFAPSTSLVSIPLESVDAPFIFTEVSADFQEVTVQGQVSYRVIDPKRLAGLMNFTQAADGEHVSEDPQRLPQRVVNAVQVGLGTVISARPLEALLRESAQLAPSVREHLRGPEGIASLGLELVDLTVLAVRPNPDTARALEATVREQILKQADDATYRRRNAAIEQERAIRENELNTEIAVEAKKRQIREAQLEAERAALEKQQEIKQLDMSGRIELEDRNKALVALRGENAQREADVRAYAMAAMLGTVRDLDPKLLQALNLGHADPSALIATAFQGLAENAERIGELNISPELLQQLTGGR